MLKLSRLADYGIVIMTHCAKQRGRSANASDIAAATGVPAPMASKVLKLLTRGELLVSQRGAKGGYILARDASAITIREIITALDGPIALTACVDEGAEGCDLHRLCPAATNWQRINDAIRDALDGITLSEMASTIPPAFGVGDVRIAARQG
ncbi:MAG: SUF system Fe-S cluster assembly regulator [Geminicoccaceae bacterium]